MDVRFVTSNDGKFHEVRSLLAEYGLSVRRIRRILPEPQTDRLETVVRSKLGALPRTAQPTIVEDSGLFISALQGFPGVYSAHFYRVWGFAPILELLRRRPRRATFRTVAGLRWDGRIQLFSGETHGEIVRRPRGRLGFGFDPVFRPTGSRRTFAQMTTEEKNRYSHRAQAFRQLGAFLARRRSPASARRSAGKRPAKSKDTKRPKR